jgi:hypothetical protein
VVFFLHPLAVGANITRLSWVFALPLLVAGARLPTAAVAVLAAAVALVPGTDLVTQVATATDRSAREAYYRPLVAALAQQRDVERGKHGQRVEVLDTRGHWASVYVSRDNGLARGWERQADRELNPLFYGQAPLDDASYRTWLDQLAVGWVAVPAARLDYASVAEARLVAAGPDYLQPVWASRDWTLYRVVDSTPLSRRAAVVSTDDRAITLTVPDDRSVPLSLRWSPYLVVTDRHSVLRGCVGQSHGWAFIRVPAAGQYRVTADFPGQLRRRQPACRPGLGGPHAGAS